MEQIRLPVSQSSFEYKQFFREEIKPAYLTDLGALFGGDCVEVLAKVQDESIDAVFADPPFNLGKKYGSRTNDNLDEEYYIEWCKKWLFECSRITRPGGAVFTYNLPKWNMVLGAYLIGLGLEFRHWIAVEQGACFPIRNKLHPSHYSLLYFTKGRPKTFRKIRTPIETCRHCGGEIKDYGGHRKAMNPNGVGLKDVWIDIPPVRHKKFKSGGRKANALSTKLLDRVVEMSTVPGDVVLDPFGGGGTTYVVCEKKGRRWIGVEIDYVDDIVERLESGDIKHHRNDDFVED